MTPGHHPRSGREDLLAEVTARLCRTGDRREVLAVAAEAAGALAGDGPEVGAVLLLGSETLHAHSATGSLRGYAGCSVRVSDLPAAVRAPVSAGGIARWPADLPSLGFPPPAPMASGSGGHDDPERRASSGVVLAAVAVRGVAHGLLVVTGVEPGLGAAEAALSILAGQVALALDGLGSARWVRTVVERSGDLVLVLQPDATIRLANEATRPMLGVDPAALTGVPLIELLPEHDIETMLRLLADLLSGQTEEHHHEFRLRHSDGGVVDVEGSLVSLLPVPEVHGIVLTARDVRERKSLEAQLTHWALHDPLTNLANRLALHDRLRRPPVGTAGRALLLVDLDDFKAVNDGLGHDEGDRLLVAVAGRIRRCARQRDTVARLGGDEFVLLAEDIRSHDDAAALADRLIAALEEPFHVGALDVQVPASIGVRMIESDADPDQFLRDADLAMYSAKARGKATWALFEPSMHHAAEERFELRAALRGAVDRDEFVLHYQPTVAVSDGRLLGFEALVRWQHPRRGLLAPGQFIRHAEESGLIVPIGASVLRAACRQLAALQAIDPLLTMAVNLSVRQLETDDIVDVIADAVGQARLDPAQLTLEVTESLLVSESPEMAHRLQAIKALGVKLAIDDFGTGFSSLGYLQHLPVDIIKIDRSFIGGLKRSGSQPALVRTIISLSAMLGLETVAEGVETDQQLEALRDLACPVAQGFLFARPMDGPAALAYAAAKWPAVPVSPGRAEPAARGFQEKVSSARG